MAKANLKGAFGVDKVKEFGGICRGGSKSGSESKRGSFNAFDICNFRVLPDGSLEKREGFNHIFTLPGEPRAFWCGFLDGEEMCFALIGAALYSIDLKNKVSEVIGTVSTSEGKAEIFFCRGMLYLVDGNDFYRYDGEDLMSFSGYVPLFGKNLSGEYGGEIYEPVNFLSDKIRIRYKLSGDRIVFYTGIECAKIISAYFNGRDCIGSVSLSFDGMRILLPEPFSEEGIFEVVLQLSEKHRRRSELLGVSRGTVYGGEDDGRILLYGGKDNSKLFVSREVPHSSYLESVRADPSSCDIYFPISDTVSVSYGKCPITSVCRHGDRLLIFTKNETWIADFTVKNDVPHVVPFDSSVGCKSENGTVLAGDPFVVSPNGIYCFSSDRGIREESGAVCISGDVEGMLDDSFFSNCVSFFYKDRGEIWFSDPYSEEQNVFIYSVICEKWYRFSPIPIDQFFVFDQNVCTLYGKYVFSFSQDYVTDTSIDGVYRAAIGAYYESNPTDFGYPERTKHLGRVLAKADCDGYPFSISVIGDMGGKKILDIVDGGDNKGKYVTYFDSRSGIGRFREMNYLICAGTSGRTRIMSLTLSALK